MPTLPSEIYGPVADATEAIGVMAQNVETPPEALYLDGSSTVQQEQLITDLKSTLQTVLHAGVQVGLAIPAPQRKTEITDRFETLFLASREEYSAAAQTIVRLVLADAARSDGLRQFSTEPVLTAEDIMLTEDTETQFCLLSEITQTGTDLQLSASEASVLTDMFSVEQSTVIEQLAKNLEAGTYDAAIAADLLRVTEPSERAPKEQTKLQELAQFYKTVTSAASPQTTEVDFIAHMQAWPSEYRALIQTKRAALQAKLETIQATSAIQRERYEIEEGALPADLLHNAAGRLGSLLVKAGIDPETAVQTVSYLAANPDRPLVRVNKGNLVQGVVQSASAEFKQDKSPHFKLVAMNARSFETADFESDEFAKLIDDFMSKNGASNVALASDVAQTLVCMSKLDFKRGEAYGAKKFLQKVRLSEHSPKYKPGSHQEYSIWEYKPVSAYGTGIRSQKGNKIRVLFTILENNTLGVLSIFNRDDLSEQLRRLSGERRRND